MSHLLQTVLGDLDHEFANTRRILERLPEAQLDFTPHEKSFTLGKLARHLCDFPWWAIVTVDTTELNFDNPFPPQETPTTKAGFLALWDAEVAKCKARLDSVTDEELGVTWSAKAGGQVVMAMPRIAVLRGVVVNHMIHHRGQLTVYLRLLGVPVPGLYGPSADER